MLKKTRIQRKIFSLLLLTTLSCFIFTGCSKSNNNNKENIDNQTVLTLKVPPIAATVTDHPEIRQCSDFLKKCAESFIAEYSENNVHINIEEFELGNEHAAISDCFGTDDAADILYDRYSSMAEFVYTGHVVPLDDIISDEIRRDIDEIYWTTSCANGKTYMMPYRSYQNIMAYNKDLFFTCGLEKYVSNENIIQNWSLEEWEYILDTLAEKLPEDTYPMMMYAADSQGDTHTIALSQIFGNVFFNDKDEYFNLESPEGIKSLTWIADGVKRGWYVPQPENLTIVDCTALYQNNQLAINVINLANMPANFGIPSGYVTFPSVDGNGYVTSYLNGFEVFDNGNDTKVRIAKDFIKYIYENEECLSYSAGGIPTSSKITKKYHDKIFMLDEFNRTKKYTISYMENNPNWLGIHSVWYKHIHDLLLMKKDAKEIAVEIDTDCNTMIEKAYSKSKLHK